jgi:hypothetical protein
MVPKIITSCHLSDNYRQFVESLASIFWVEMTFYAGDGGKMFLRTAETYTCNYTAPKPYKILNLIILVFLHMNDIDISRAS